MEADVSVTHWCRGWGVGGLVEQLGEETATGRRAG